MLCSFTREAWGALESMKVHVRRHWPEIVPRMDFHIVLAGLIAIIVASSGFANEVTYDRLLNTSQEPQNWLHIHGNYSSTRFSKLDQINTNSVKNLSLAFAVSIGGQQSSRMSGGTLQGTPLVNNGYMYVANGWGETYKIDVRSGRQGIIRWIMDPAVNPLQVDMPNNRGVALWGNNVYTATLDGRVISTDMDTGIVVWERQVTTNTGESFTGGGPLAVKDMVLIGQSWGDNGTRGWLEAIKAKDGTKVWRTQMIPDPGEPGHETWEDVHNSYKTGGASLWVTGSFDPDTNLTFWGTGNPAPMFDPEYRPGDNLYSSSTVAMDIDTGAISWYFQYTPGNYLDYDEVGSQLLYDAEINGETRKLLGHFGRNGFYYTIDRTTGTFIKGTPYLDKITWTEGIDPSTGKPKGYNPNKPLQEYITGGAPRRGKPAIEACPHFRGGVNFWPTAYNPILKVAYGAAFEGCFHVAPSGKQINDPNKVVPGELFLGGTWYVKNPIYGSIIGVDVMRTAIAIKTIHPFPHYGGILATAGNLVFAGHLDGTFAAYDSVTLMELWSINLGGAFKAPPMTYSVNGQQYVAILMGGGGTNLSPLSTPELNNIQNSGMLFVFSL